MARRQTRGLDDLHDRPFDPPWTDSWSCSPITGSRRWRTYGAGRCPTWRNAPFRGYADHIGSAEFSPGRDELLELSGRLRNTLMCAEAARWRCHRALIADVLCVRGVEVVHILDAKHTFVHPYTSPARIVQGGLSYVPAESEGQ